MVRYIRGKDAPTEINVREFTGDGSTLTSTVTQGMTVDKILVTENGVLQKPTADYTISGTTITFTAAPETGVQVLIRELPI